MFVRLSRDCVMLFALLYPTDGVVGSVPQSVIDDQEEFIRNSHAISSDLVNKPQHKIAL